MSLTRRDVLIIGAGASPAGLRRRRAPRGRAPRHVGVRRSQYPADFAHFDYVDPNAPKGGRFSQIGPIRFYNQNFQTFNSLNSFILKGDAAQGMELTFASLMKTATDEPDAMYGLAARTVRISEDGLTYRYAMRPEARFHDGSRLTAHDAAFSLNILKEQGHPLIAQRMRDYAGAEATDDMTLVVRFAPRRARDVPLFVASLPIFSRLLCDHRVRESISTSRRSGHRRRRFDAGTKSMRAWRTGGARSVAAPVRQFDILLRILSRPQVSLRVHGEELSARENHLARGRRVTTFGACEGRVAAMCFLTTPRRARRAVLNQWRDSSRTVACARR